MFLDVSRFSFEGSAQGEIRPVGGTRVPSEARKSLALVAGVFFYLVSVYACFMYALYLGIALMLHVLVYLVCSFTGTEVVVIRAWFIRSNM